MSNFLRDLAIAKFPRFGITYYVQCNGEPEIQGKNMAAPLKFYDGKTVPPTHLADKTVKMPLWKWGEMLDVIEEECFAEYPSIVAVELIKRRPDDAYGNLRIQLTKQVQLDSNLRDAPPEQEGPSKPQAGDCITEQGLAEITLPPAACSHQAGGETVTEALVSQGSERGSLRASQEDRADQNRASTDTPTLQDTQPFAACSHPALDRIVLHDLADVLVWECGVCLDVVTVLKDRAEVRQ